MYLRFKTCFRGDDHESRYGVFQAAIFLLHREDATMCPYERERLSKVWDWFVVNLKEPHIFKDKKSYQDAICWFKPSACLHLQKMYEMVTILEEYYLSISIIRSVRPGYIVYEDDEQVVAVPFTKLVKQVR